MFFGSSMTLQRLAGNVIHWKIDDKLSSVNVLSTKALKQWEEILSILEQTENIDGLVISSNKGCFIAGADVKEFPAFFKSSEVEIEQWALCAQELCNRLERLPFPTVALLDGATLGGGLEFALSVDFRLATSRAVLGLPEVTLGICPGWGGSVRLTRMLGLDVASPWITGGEHMNVTQAFDLGLVDKIAENTDLLDEALELLSAESTPSRVQAGRDRKNATGEMLVGYSAEPYYVKGRSKLVADRIQAFLKTQYLMSFDAALNAERKLFASLAKGDEAEALIGLFKIEQEAKSSAKRFARTVSLDQCVVVGAGVMGAGIALQAASASVRTGILDTADIALQNAIKNISNTLDKQVARGRSTEAETSATLDKISCHMGWQGLQATDLVVEAVVERKDVKLQVLQNAERATGDSAILTSNTSTIPIDVIAAGLTRPERFCGMHFFNPVPQMPLVEVIRGSLTSAETVDAVTGFAARMGKIPIVVNDCPGFVVNRILFPYFNAFNLLLWGGIDFQRIDRVMESFGWPMGPARLADVIGLDVMVHADRVLQIGFPERMSHSVPVAAELLFESGLLGVKNGRGFYEYSTKDRASAKPSNEALAFLERNITKLNLTDEEIVNRLMVPLCTEAIRCIEDGIVGEASQVDLAAVLGLGFPRIYGGPLRYIDQRGIVKFCNLVKSLSTLGPLYALPKLLERADDNVSLYDYEREF